MCPAYTSSATRRRCEEQLERLDTIPADALVSALKPVGEDQTRFRVHIGRIRFGPIHVNDLHASDIVVGAPLDTTTRTHLAQAIAREAARADALSLLRTRARSSRDLLHRLARKGHDRPASLAALDRLARVGLIDDATFAADRAGAFARSGSTGPRAAEAKLRAHGIEGPIAVEAVREAFADCDLLAQATEAACKRIRTFRDDLDEKTRTRRLYGFLARRGYDHDTCHKAVNAALARYTD